MSFQENTLYSISTETEVSSLLPDSVVIDRMGLAWQLMETTQGYAWISTMPGRAYFFASDTVEFVRRRGPFLAAPYVMHDE